VDDDEVFCRIMEKQASQFGIELNTISEVSKLAKAGDVNAYDVVLVDHYLGKFNGTALSRFLSVFYSTVPVVMISSSSLWWHRSGTRWPSNVRRFVHKDRTMKDILVQAMEVATNSDLEEDEEDDGSPSSPSRAA
jgi:DNA-binding NtrC family response regulator